MEARDVNQTEHSLTEGQLEDITNSETDGAADFVSCNLQLAGSKVIVFRGELCWSHKSSDKNLN